MEHDVMYLHSQQQQHQQQHQLFQQQQILQQILQPQQAQSQPQHVLQHHSQHQLQQQIQHHQQQQQKIKNRRTGQTPEDAAKKMRLCAVCSELAAGKYFGAEVCVPCKTFYLRYANTGDTFVCKANNNCLITSTQRTCCKRCRYKKCVEAGMIRKLRPLNVALQEGQQKCVVCSDVANGIHFGALTCEGCKKFFRRGMNESHTYVCKSNKTCTINPRTRNTCRYCRYQKCIAHHMSREAIQMGRPSKMNVMSVLPVQKKTKQPNQQVALHLPQHQQQFQQQSQQQQQQSLQQQQSQQQQMAVLAHSSNSNAQNNFYMKQLSSNIDTNQHHYIGELLQVSKLDPSSNFAKFAADDSKMRYSCGSDSRSLIGYAEQNQNAGQPINYIINNKQASGDEEKSYFNNSFTISGGTQSFTSNLAVSWAGDMSQTLPRGQKTQDGYCDGKIKMEQENPALFYYVNNNSGNGGVGGIQNAFDSSIDWTDELAYRQADVLSEFSQPLHHSSSSPSSIADEIFNGTVEQHQQVDSLQSEAAENQLGLFGFDGGLDTFSNGFDSIQPFTAFSTQVHVPSSGIVDPKSLLSQHNQAQSFQDIFGASGLTISSQDVQEVLESAHKIPDMPFSNMEYCSLETLMRSAENAIQDASSNGEPRFKWNHQNLMEKQFKHETFSSDSSEDDLSKAETDFKVEDGFFEDGSHYETLANRSAHYWKSLVLPKSDTHWMSDFDSVCKSIIAPYKRFIKEMTALNQRLAIEFDSWLKTERQQLCDVSEFVEKRVVPEFTKVSVAYVKAIPWFVMLKPEDQKVILRFAQCPSRVLVAALHWFDRRTEQFFPEFLPWRRLPDRPDPFFKKLEDFARKIQRVKLNDIEECLFNVVVIISADYPNLTSPEEVKAISLKFLTIFRAYTTVQSMRGSENTRLEFILSYVAELRHLGLLHHMSTTRPHMLVSSNNSSSLYSNLETLESILVNGVDSKPINKVAERSSNNNNNVCSSTN